MPEHLAWPPLPYNEWAPTKKTLQMCAQMLGKTRLALAPPQPEWLHSCLYLDARGFTTGAMPYGERVVSAGIDVFDSLLWVCGSDGRSVMVALGPDKCVADIWGEYQGALADVGVEVDIWEKPQELADVTPFSENRHDCTFVAEHAQRFHRLLCSIDGVFEEFRSKFFGRTSIQYWWGASDFAVLLFNGKHLDAPEDKGYIMRYDLDAEHFNAGFWPGDDSSPSPGLLRVPGASARRVRDRAHVAGARGVGRGHGGVDHGLRRGSGVRRSARSGVRLPESVYRVAITEGGWDAVRSTAMPRRRSRHETSASGEEPRYATVRERQSKSHPLVAEMGMGRTYWCRCGGGAHGSVLRRVPRGQRCDAAGVRGRQRSADAICNCGLTSNPPYCDGSHANIE